MNPSDCSLQVVERAARSTSPANAAYADDAEVRVVDRNNPPRSPQILKGKPEIKIWLEDTYSRDMTHKVVNPVVGTDRVALTTQCRYPDGTNVLCACTADLSDGLISKQSVVQVWDE